MRVGIRARIHERDAGMCRCGHVSPLGSAPRAPLSTRARLRLPCAPMTARKRAGARRMRETEAVRPREPAAPRLLVLALALAFALRAAASLLPIPGMWGLDMLRVWPRSRAIPLLLLGALG